MEQGIIYCLAMCLMVKIFIIELLHRSKMFVTVGVNPREKIDRNCFGEIFEIKIKNCDKTEGHRHRIIIYNR